MNNYDIFEGNDLEIADKILRRRLQMLIHSCLYYNLNTNIVDDRQFDTWARELVQLQKENIDISKKVAWAEAFENFDGHTGFDLPINDPWVIKKANYILKGHT